MAQLVTRELLERIDGEFEAATTAEEVRLVFKRYSGDLGWNGFAASLFSSTAWMSSGWRNRSGPGRVTRRGRTEVSGRVAARDQLSGTALLAVGSSLPMDPLGWPDMTDSPEPASLPSERATT